MTLAARRAALWQCDLLLEGPQGMDEFDFIMKKRKLHEEADKKVVDSSRSEVAAPEIPSRIFTATSGPLTSSVLHRSGCGGLEMAAIFPAFSLAIHCSRRKMSPCRGISTIWTKAEPAASHGLNTTWALGRQSRSRIWQQIAIPGGCRWMAASAKMDDRHHDNRSLMRRFLKNADP